MRGLGGMRRSSEAHEQGAVAVTAGVTVASQGRDAAPLNWLRNRNLAPLPGHGNHSAEERGDETNQWKARRRPSVPAADVGMQSGQAGRAPLARVRRG